MNKKPTAKEKYNAYKKERKAKDSTDYVVFFVDNQEAGRSPLYNDGDYERAVEDFKKQHGIEVKFRTEMRSVSYE